MHIDVVQKVMKLNDELAAGVRERLRAANVAAVNLISAPGSGKTSLIECALRSVDGRVRVGVLEGDPDTTLDAERVAACGVPVVQIQTAGGCHLEAHLVARALDRLPLDDIDLLVVENVGNLVCPVDFDLGESARAAIVSVAEGHDKPAKYPKLFRTTDTVVLNKIDLLPYVDFDETKFMEYVRCINPRARILRTSCRSGDGVAAWTDWLASIAARTAQAPAT
ncbi:MAG: hydrogenase nickel incorporation protein HypB [Candidatus Hydrogenedentes bacterium]|nr:hydrogenase nickel incorporation protein HypB [Candidatus Hydrogenedentota bacterium]